MKTAALTVCIVLMVVCVIGAAITVAALNEPGREVNNDE